MEKLSDFITPTYAETHDLPGSHCCGGPAIIFLIMKIVKHKIKK